MRSESAKLASFDTPQLRHLLVYEMGDMNRRETAVLANRRVFVDNISTLEGLGQTGELEQ
jgi:hypothetical protein